MIINKIESTTRVVYFSNWTDRIVNKMYSHRETGPKAWMQTGMWLIDPRTCIWSVRSRIAIDIRRQVEKAILGSNLATCKQLLITIIVFCKQLLELFFF